MGVRLVGHRRGGGPLAFLHRLGFGEARRARLGGTTMPPKGRERQRRPHARRDVDCKLIFSNGLCASPYLAARSAHLCSKPVSALSVLAYATPHRTPRLWNE